MRIFLEKGGSVYISERNTKMQAVWSFSVPPVLTCKKDVPCKSNCYAVKLLRFRKNLNNSLQENFTALNCGDHQEIIEKLSGVINALQIPLFRFNVSGDFGIQGYFQLANEIAKRCPGTQFLAFTKYYNLSKFKRVANFNLVYSVWNEYKPADISNIPTAHYNDGSRAMPKDAVRCNGNCADCLTCFFLKPGQKVYFDKH
jgi:hypothetical protein